MTAGRRERIEAAFRRNFQDRGEIGASVSIWEEGEETLTLSGGVTERGGAAEWRRDTLIPIYSATKGVAVVTLLSRIADEGIGPDSEVRRIWPEFAGGGKGEVTIRELLSHQGGVAALDSPVDIADHEATVRAIELQVPNWTLGLGKHGYHPRTYGAILDELVRRLSGGTRLGAVWRESIAEPWGIDIWLGVPDCEFGRIGRLSGPREMLSDEFTKAYLDPESLTRRAFESPSGFQGIGKMNQADGWTLGNAAMGGLASAVGLGKFYGLLGRIVRPEVFGWMAGAVVDGMDRVLCAKTSFSHGMMVKPGGFDGFGHPGAGGSLGFYSSDRDLGFGYVMNQLGAGALPGERPKALAMAAVGG